MEIMIYNYYSIHFFRLFKILAQVYQCKVHFLQKHNFNENFKSINHL
jgi:hypothetical protein